MGSVNYLSHHGIEGQRWGVRRFQNKDGTLTEEGRKRYLSEYDKIEKKADEDIARAKNQLLDIDKNGWYAESAFDKGFVKQIKREGMMNNYNLEMYRGIFEQDLEEAKLSKKAAQEAKKFIEDNKNVTVDDVISENKRIDSENQTKLNEKATEIADKLNLDRKKGEDVTLKFPDYDADAKKQVHSIYSDREIKTYNKVFYKELKSLGINPDLISIPGNNGKIRFKDMPYDQQFYIMYTLLYNMNES